MICENVGKLAFGGSNNWKWWAVTCEFSMGETVLCKYAYTHIGRGKVEKYKKIYAKSGRCEYSFG